MGIRQIGWNVPKGLKVYFRKLRRKKITLGRVFYDDFYRETSIATQSAVFKMSTKMFACAVCGNEFLTVGVLLNHVSKHKVEEIKDSISIQGEKKVEIEDMEGVEKGPKKSDKVGNPKKKEFPCTYCSKAFKSAKQTENHEFNVHVKKVEKPFKCRHSMHCQKSFKTKNYRDDHEKIHTGEKLLKCQYCPKTFAHSISKYSHEKIHTQGKTFQCGYCPKKFLTATHKKVHERFHTGEKPFKCDFCEKTFHIAGSRNIHMKTHTL